MFKRFYECGYCPHVFMIGVRSCGGIYRDCRRIWGAYPEHDADVPGGLPLRRLCSGRKLHNINIPCPLTLLLPQVLS